MWRGGRPGHHLRGGKPGIDTSFSSPDIHSYRVGNGNVGTYTGWNRDAVYQWGRVHGSTPVANGVTPSANILYAVPLIIGVEGAIAKILNAQRSGGGLEGLLIWAIYANTGKGQLYPGTLIDDSGEVSWIGNQNYSWSPNLSLEPGIYWLASVFNAAFVADAKTLDIITPVEMLPLLGTPADLKNANTTVANPQWAVAVRHNYNFAAVPSSYPTTSPTFITNNGAGGPNIPTAYFQWTESG